MATTIKKKQQREVAIIHFNTPELTEAAILSLRKHGGEDYHVTIFDNSRSVTLYQEVTKQPYTLQARPFKKRMKGVKVIDNTKGQVIDFEEELAKFPDRITAHGECNGWASDIHMMSVQKLWDIIDAPFILMESDVLLRQDINQMWNEYYAAVGHRQIYQPGNKCGIGRLLPFLCFMNVPVLKAAGAKYFDPERSWMLHPDENDPRNWYDTGAALLEDVLKTKPELKGLLVFLPPVIVHYAGGSWRKNDLATQQAWLDEHAELWK